MTSRAQMQLLFHGTIIVLGGMLSGLPLAVAIASEAGPETIHAWRVTHSSFAAAGVTLIAIAAVARHLVLREWESRPLLWTLIGSNYALLIGLVVSAVSGARGLEPVGPALNLALYVSNVAGVCGALSAGVMLVHGAYAALRGAARSPLPVAAMVGRGA